MLDRTKDAASSTPLIESAADGDTLRIAGSGRWTANHAAALESAIVPLGKQVRAFRHVVIDLSGVGRMDTFGAWLLVRMLRGLETRNCDASVVGLAPVYQPLVDELQDVGNLPPVKGGTPHIFARGLKLLGKTVVDLSKDLLAIIAMLGEVGASLLRAIMQPWKFRLTSTVHHIDRVGWRAVPIVMLITFLIGAIIAQQGLFNLRRFGADVFVVDMLSILVMREIGVLIVCIMVAGRSGSAYTAELGSMKMREEIDALRTMGLNPTDILILPRIVALLISIPILTFIGSMAALYGGALVAWIYGDIRPDVFLSRLKDAITIKTFVVGLIKAPFMAMVIGVVACAEGLQVQGSAESLGSHTTASVVKSIFLVIVLDGFFAIFFASIGI